MTEIDAAHHSEFVERFETTGIARVIGRPREVQGKHRAGHALSLRLAVTPGSRPGKYIGILYDQSNRERIWNAEMERVKLEIQSSAGILGSSTSTDLKSIRRGSFQTEAWNPGNWQPAFLPDRPPVEKLPVVLGAFSDDGLSFRAFRLKLGIPSTKETKINKKVRVYKTRT